MTPSSNEQTSAQINSLHLQEQWLLGEMYASRAETEKIQKSRWLSGFIPKSKELLKEYVNMSTNKQTKQELDSGNYHGSSLGQFEHQNKQ